MISLSSGYSEKDRISFYTNTDGATAIRNKNGEIVFKYGTMEPEFINKLLIVFLVFFGLPSIIKRFVLMPLIETNTIIIIWYLIPSFLYFLLLVLGIISIRITGGKELLRNHGAEHMVFLAYKKLKKLPSIEEAKNFSRINKTCGVTIFSSFITSQIIGFIVYTYTDFIIPEILLFFLPVFFQSFFPFNFIGKLAQFFTTSKPENHNIELAIAALSALEQRELEDISTDNISDISKN